METPVDSFIKASFGLENKFLVSNTVCGSLTEPTSDIACINGNDFFELNYFLGKGKSGMVYHSTRLTDKLDYAIKILEMNKEEPLIYLMEIERLGSFRHPYLPMFHDAFIIPNPSKGID